MGGSIGILNETHQVLTVSLISKMNSCCSAKVMPGAVGMIDSGISRTYYKLTICVDRREVVVKNNVFANGAIFTVTQGDERFECYLESQLKCCRLKKGEKLAIEFTDGNVVKAVGAEVSIVKPGWKLVRVGSYTTEALPVSKIYELFHTEYLDKDVVLVFQTLEKESLFSKALSNVRSIDSQTRRNLKRSDSDQPLRLKDWYVLHEQHKKQLVKDREVRKNMILRMQQEFKDEEKAMLERSMTRMQNNQEKHSEDFIPTDNLDTRKFKYPIIEAVERMQLLGVDCENLTALEFLAVEIRYIQATMEIMNIIRGGLWDPLEDDYEKGWEIHSLGSTGSHYWEDQDGMITLEPPIEDFWVMLPNLKADKMSMFEFPVKTRSRKKKSRPKLSLDNSDSLQLVSDSSESRFRNIPVVGELFARKTTSMEVDL